MLGASARLVEGGMQEREQRAAGSGGAASHRETNVLMDGGERIPLDECGHAREVRRVKPLERLVVHALESIRRVVAEGGAAAVIDEDVVREADAEAERHCALAEVVLLPEAAPEILLVEEADAREHRGGYVHAEPVRRHEIGTELQASLGHEAGEPVEREAGGNRIGLAPCRDATDGGVVRQRRDDARLPVVRGSVKTFEKPLRNGGVTVQEQHVAPGGVSHASIR